MRNNLRMGGPVGRAFTFVLAIMVLLSGCTLWQQQPSPTPSTVAAVVAGRITVGGADAPVSGLSVSEVTLGAKEIADLSGWGDLPMAVGRPSEIRIDGGTLPAEGLRITRHYERALPKDATATLAYFSTEWDSWVAVPSEVAPDRTSVSAVVHHLSWWTDFVGGTQQAMKSVGDAAAGVADWAYYNVGKIFDTRVDPPKCSSGRPSWVHSTTFIETQRNNSLLFCVGIDEAKPGLLVIKARVNRGFGFNAETPVTPAWTYNSSFEEGDLKTALQVLADIDKVLADSVRKVTSDGRMTAPGQEFSLGLSEAAARKQSSSLALKMTPQAVVPFLQTILAQLIGTDVTFKADGYVAAVIATAKCAKDVSGVTDGGTLAKAVLSCVSGIDEDVAKHLAVYFLKRGMADPGKLAGYIVGRASIYLACLGPVFNAMNYFAEQHLNESSRTVNVFTTTPGPANRIQLGAGATLILNGVRYGRGGPAEIAALQRALGTPDSTSAATCYDSKVTVRRWQGLVIYSLKKRTLLDEGSQSTAEAGGISGWLWAGNVPSTQVTGPEGINLGSTFKAALKRLNDREFIIRSEAYTVWGLLGDTVDVRLDFNPSNDTATRISAGICADR